MARRQRIVIVGGGAIGLSYASLLCRAADVVVLARPVTAKALREGMLRVVRDDSGLEVVLPSRYAVTESLDDVGDADLVLVCVKSYDTDAVAKELAASNTSGLIVTIQNGVGNREVLASRVPVIRVRVGACYVAARRLRADTFELVRVGPTILEGDPAEPAERALTAAFSAAGLPIEFRADAEEMLWNKLALAVGGNALTALCRVPLAPFADRASAPTLSSLAEDAIRECIAVMEAKGLRFDGDPSTLLAEAGALAASNHSSMLQDILAGRRTEVDAINGAVAAEAALLGIAAPLNTVLTRLVHALEETAPWR